MLVNLPLKDQLNDANSDGNPDNNANANCVAEVMASIAEEASGQNVHGGDLKDAVYGVAYVGATNPDNYAKVLHDEYRVDLQMFAGDGNAMVQTIISHLKNHTAVAGAIPSQWGNTTAADIAAHGGGTHEVGFCDYDGTNLTAMNPWPVDGHNAFYHTMPAAWWASRLVYGHVHVANKEIAAVAVDTNGLGQGFASYAEAHNVSQVSGGEHYYDANNTFCGLSDGEVLWYDKQTNQMDANKGAWVATALWNQREQYRQQAEELQGKVDALTVAVASLNAQLAAKPTGSGVPAELHPFLASLVNALGPTATLVTEASALLSKIGN